MATTITANGINFPDGSASAPSIGGTDTNTGLFTGSDLVGFATGGTERLRITSDGELLVGTTVDNGFKFKVSDGGGYEFAFAPNDSSINSLVNYDRANGAYVDCKITSRSLRLWIGTSPSEKIRITSDGDVGIGTTSPTNQFHVYDSAAANDTPEIKIEAFRPALRFKDRSSNSVSAEIVGDNSLKFRVSTPVDDSTPLTERMRIDSGGNVGIGTTSPSAKLQVGGATIIGTANTTKTQDGVIIERNSGDGLAHITAGRAGGNYSGMNFYVAGASGVTLRQQIDYQSNFKFFGADGTSERLRITSAGKVGIGTTSPAKALEIKSGMNSDGFSILKGSNSSVFLGHNGSGDEGLLQLKDGGTTTIQIYGETGQTSYFNAGNVGIGTTSPDAPLTVHSSSDPEIRFGYTSSQDHRIAWDSSKVYIHADPENANSNSALGLSVDGSTKLYITDAGKVGIGDTSPDCKLHVNSGAADDALKIESTDASVNLILRDSVCTSLIQQNNTTLMIGSDSANTTAGSIIAFYVDGTEQARIANGISFNGDTSTSNMLNDYEEGTWTPNIVGHWSSAWRDATHDGTVYGRYVKVGNLCYIYGYLDNVQISGNAVNTHAAIWNLPFNHANTNYGSTISVTHSNIFSNCDAGNFYIGHNTNRMYSSQYGDNDYQYCSWSGSDTRYMMFSGCYQTS